MDTITVSELQDANDAGGCNACTREVNQVYVVRLQRTEYAAQAITLCDDCRRLLIRGLSQVAQVETTLSDAGLGSVSSSIAAMIIKKRLEAGGTVEIPSLNITLTKDDLRQSND
jgi:hypothetical protein